jgi:exonuclease VII small subunit
MLSAATGGYGLTLAGVAGMQAAAENALIAERAPTVGGLEEVGAAHDRLAVDLEDAVRNYQRAADRYAAATTILDQVDRQLAKVASAVSEIDGTVRKLPTSIRVPVSRTVTTVKAPATHATTGASGG